MLIALGIGAVAALAHGGRHRRDGRPHAAIGSPWHVAAAHHAGRGRIGHKRLDRDRKHVALERSVTSDPATPAATPATPAATPAAPTAASQRAAAQCTDHCDAGTDNSNCHDHCEGSGDANCHDHCDGDGDTYCHDHCYGQGDTYCHDHCYGAGASYCHDTCENSDTGGAQAQTQTTTTPSPPPPSQSPPPSSQSQPPSSPSSPPASTPPPSSTTQTVTPIPPTTTAPPSSSLGGSEHITRPVPPSVGLAANPFVGSNPGGANSEAFEAGTPGQGASTTSATGRGVTRALAPGTTSLAARARSRERQAVLGARVTRRPRGQRGVATGPGSSTVVDRFITSIPTAIWAVLGALLLLAVVAAASALRSSRHARRQAAVAAAVGAAALTDSLTGILNRRGFVDAFKRELDRARRYGRPLALAFVDVRGLKAVNDSHGHLAGDRLLKDVAAMLGESARAHDVVGRIGGDELAVLLPEQSADGVARVVQRVRGQVTMRRHALGFETPWDLTVGVALFPEDGDDVEELLEAADRRLYQQRGIEIRDGSPR